MGCKGSLKHIQVILELLLKIMAVLAKVSILLERLPSLLVDPCLYYCCTVHQTLATLRSLCKEGCVTTVRSMCVGVHNVSSDTFFWLFFGIYLKAGIIGIIGD